MESKGWFHRKLETPFLDAPKGSTLYNYIYIFIFTEGSLEVKLPTIMDRWKAEQGRGREKRKIRRKKSRRERVRRKKMQMREKVGKSRHTAFFQWFGAPEGWKVGSLKRRVRSQLARWEMKNCTPLWREAHFQVKMYKAPQLRSTFRSCDVDKVHAIVARSTCPSQNVQSTSASDHFWKLRCRKSARRCGAKHISKSKFAKHIRTHHVRTTFGGSGVASLRFTTLHYTTLPSTTLHYITLHYTPLHYNYNYTTTLHYTPLRSTTLHNTTTTTTQLHNYTPLHSTKLHYTTLPSTTLHYTKLHYTTLHYTTLHYIPLHSTTLHYTTLHYTTLHYTEWHCTTDRQVDR